MKKHSIYRKLTIKEIAILSEISERSAKRLKKKIRIELNLKRAHIYLSDYQRYFCE